MTDRFRAVHSGSDGYCSAQYSEKGNSMEQVEYGKKYYQIRQVGYNPLKNEYFTLPGETEYKTLRGAKAALEKKTVVLRTPMYELMEYEYDPENPGLICNEKRLLIKDESGIYAD